MAGDALHAGRLQHRRRLVALRSSVRLRSAAAGVGALRALRVLRAVGRVAQAAGAWAAGAGEGVGAARPIGGSTSSHEAKNSVPRRPTSDSSSPSSTRRPAEHSSDSCGQRQRARSQGDALGEGRARTGSRRVGGWRHRMQPRDTKAGKAPRPHLRELLRAAKVAGGGRVGVPQLQRIQHEVQARALLGVKRGQGGVGQAGGHREHLRGGGREGSMVRVPPAAGAPVSARLTSQRKERRGAGAMPWAGWAVKGSWFGSGGSLARAARRARPITEQGWSAFCGTPSPHLADKRTQHAAVHQLLQSGRQLGEDAGAAGSGRHVGTAGKQRRRDQQRDKSTTECHGA